MTEIENLPSIPVMHPDDISGTTTMTPVTGSFDTESTTIPSILTSDWEYAVPEKRKIDKTAANNVLQMNLALIPFIYYAKVNGRYCDAVKQPLSRS